MASTLETLTLKAYYKAASLGRALPAERKEYRQWPMTVTAVRDVAEHVRRVTFSAAEFEQYKPLGYDEYFGLMMPPSGGELVMPDPETINVRSAIAKLDEAVRPDLRFYTIRTHRPGDAEVDVDVVLHGDAGPASAWAMRAEVGAEVGFRTGSGSYTLGNPGERHLVVGDETATPAIAAMMDAATDAGASIAARMDVIVEAPTAGHISPLPDTPSEATVLLRGDDVPGSAVSKHVAEMDAVDYDYAWVCGESSLATGIRRHLVKERGMRKRSIMFSGYWKLGAPRT